MRTLLNHADQFGMLRNNRRDEKELDLRNARWRRSRRKYSCRLALRMLLVVLSFSSVDAQQTAATIQGKVLNPSGAPIANAAVRLEHADSAPVEATTSA